MCMQDHPPQHRHFKDKKIPAHITYAYKKDARIVRNDDFYKLPEGETRTVDLLFLIANAPVKTASLPEAGSESYVGLAIAMELAMNELSDEFPSFFVEENKPSNECKRWYVIVFTNMIYPLYVFCAYTRTVLVIIFIKHITF